MRAIVNERLYDTEKSIKIATIFIPRGDSHTKTLDIYKTTKGNIFAILRSENIMLDAGQIKKLLSGRSGSADEYIKIFGMPEEA